MSEDPMLGRVLGERFEIVSLLGRGGMASVYGARDTVLDRTVAIKVFAVDTSEDRARLGSEVRLLSGLNHPNLVTVHDAHLAEGPDDGLSFLVMEFVDGATLREAIATPPVSADVIVAVASGVGEALRVVHEAGIVHRDVKPANVLIERDAPTISGVRAKLADFGIARSTDSTRLTATMTVIGTAGYLSPEQAAGATVTSASDIYSLGLVVLECFTGKMEYPGTAAESLAARLGRDPVLPSTLPSGWLALLGSMLARDPAARPTALEVAQRSAALSGELAASYPVAPTEPADTARLAKTRLMPVATAVLPSSATSATRVMTSQGDAAVPQVARPTTNPWRLPTRIALIVLGAIVLAVLLVLLFRALPQSTPTPATSTPAATTPATSASPSPGPASPTPPVPPGKGKGHGKGPKGP